MTDEQQILAALRRSRDEVAGLRKALATAEKRHHQLLVDGRKAGITTDRVAKAGGVKPVTVRKWERLDRAARAPKADA